jgi:alkylhydroperoxidase family enzyme
MTSAAPQSSDPSGGGFLGPAAITADTTRLFEGDLGGTGYVTNTTRLWAHMPAALDGLSDLLGEVTRAGGLTFRQRCVLVTAAASTLGDSYCSLAWGKKLADVAGPEAAGAVIGGDDGGLASEERALAKWARLVATDPNAIGPEDVDALRACGFDDGQIFAITTFVALRLAFSTVNDALGSRPDHQLGLEVPDPVGAAVDFGRPVAEPTE